MGDSPGAELSTPANRKALWITSRVIAVGVISVFCGTSETRAQNAPSDALDRLLVAGDASFAVLSDRQLEILRQSLAVYINSLPTQTVLALDEERERRSFGPIYLQHAMPIGRGGLDAVTLLQHASWSALDSIDIREAGLINRSPGFLNHPGVESRATLSLASETFGFGARYGVRPDFEVGVMVPVQRVCVSGIRSVIVGSNATAPVDIDACGAGVGDVQISAKYVHSGTDWNLGAQVGVSLATGDPDELTGKGTTQPGFTLIASRRIGPLQPVFNLGATLGGHGVQFRTVTVFGSEALIVEQVSAPKSINYGGGALVVFGQRLTLSFEVVGRTLHNGVEFAPFGNGDSQSLELQPVHWQSNVLGVAGAKVALTDKIILSSHVSHQFSSAGLRPSWVAGASVTVAKAGTRQ